MRLLQASHLKCKKCGAEFDYEWIPSASITSMRFGKWRYMGCPSCGLSSVFNIADTMVDPDTHRCELHVGPD
jgi:hypothetical protein